MKNSNVKRHWMQLMMGAMLLAWLAALTTGCRSLFVGKGYPDYGAQLAGLPVHEPVRITRGADGIPDIHAADKHDLMVAQGFVHAQDRLWQMETLRRVATGRLAEVAGAERLNLDYFSRLIGLPRIRQQAADALGAEDRTLLQAYVDGINAYIRLRAKNLPLEFQSAGLAPEPWKIEDALSFVALNSWMFQENYISELTVLAGRQTVPPAAWKDIFPDHPGAALPDDSYFEGLRSLKIGRVDTAALSFFQALPDSVSAAGGSNIWVTANGPGGKPLLANDTHVGISVPGTWYLCHLEAPGIDIAGASAAGVPGVIIGRTQTAAWGMAILPIDSADLFIVRVDPADPTRYFAGGQTLRMDREDMTFAVKGGTHKTITAYRTVYGPVITALSPGVEAAAALHWYGTLPDGQLTDGTMRTILGFMDCRSVADIMRNVRSIRLVGLNFVAADTGGSIAWQSAGAVPLRTGYSGRLPADGSSGTMGWDGFLGPEAMPSALDPASGFIINCNNRVVSDADPSQISNSWSAPYRYERVRSLLGAMKDPSVDAFRLMQTDVYSLQAEELLPKVLAYSFKDPLAMEAAAFLRGWDHQVRADSVGAGVYEVFLSELVRALLGDELGNDLFYYYHVTFKKYLVQDVILDRPDSPLWDRIDTPQKEGPQAILTMALRETIRTLASKLGNDRSRWSWGLLHPVEWRHSGATSWFTRLLLNSGSFPADGDGTTLNANTPLVARGDYRAIHIPALRMVASLADLDDVRMIAPMGQSGQPGHPHYDDMILRWREGKLVTLGVNGSGLREAVSTLTLAP